MLATEQLRFRARRLRDLIEPIAGAVYFLPETTAAYEALGFAPRSGMTPAPSYFVSRGGCLGQVPGSVIAAAFGVFNPAVVEPFVAQGWATASVDAVLDARLAGTVSGLTRILGSGPEGAARATELLYRCADHAPFEGRMLYAGLKALPRPGSVIGDLFRSADLVREHRGDSHIAAWISHGLDAVEAQILQELWWRRPIGPYTLTRGWSLDDIAAGRSRLSADGLLDGDTLTDAGEALRGSVEDATDRSVQRVVAVLGDDADELFSLLEPMAMAIVEAKAYPVDPRLMTRY